MALFTQKSEQKSLVITTILTVGLLVALFFLGLTYMDPPEESGIAINFGTSETGYGEVQPQQPVTAAPSTDNLTESAKAEPVLTEPLETSTTELEEEITTQETEEAPVIEKKAEEIKPKEETQAKEKTATPSETKETKEAEPKEVKPDPKPDQSTTDALNSILNGKQTDGTAGQGEGNDSAAGDKGDPTGDPNATSYYGQGKGLDGDGNYRLGGRKALNKKKYVQDCNESGTVVVEIKVNREGQVVRATPGVKGTTNTSSCLLDPARRAAQETRFNADEKAPSVQTGYIIYEFRLSD